MQDSVVKVEGIDYKYITDIRFHKGVNEHGSATIKCVVEDEKAENVLKLNADAVWVSVKIGEEEGGEATTPVFSGIIQRIAVDTRQGVSEVQLELIGGSYLMDVARVTRTYQNDEAKLSNVIDVVKKNCDDAFSGNKTMINTGKECKDSFKPECKLLVQYNETDYEFLKRCASMQNLPLITSINSTNESCVNVNIGILEAGKTETLDIKYYKQEVQVIDYITDSKSGLEEAKEKDYGTMIVRCRDYFDIGSKVSIGGKTMYVYSVDSVYDSSHKTSKGGSNINKDEFWHVYLLAEEKRFQVPQHYNYKMIGASLQGEVKEVVKAKLKIECKADKENKTPAKDPLEFPFATVYSSNDGTGWYCMPEPKDVIRLYLPTEDEKDAYVISAVHLEEGTGLRDDPECKFIMNKYKKQVEFTKDSIRITNNDGLEIKLDDKKGISILSDKDINMSAAKEINVLSTKDKVNISGQTEVKVSQGATAYIDLKNTATIKGTSVDIK